VIGVIAVRNECHPEAGTSGCVAFANSCAAGEWDVLLLARVTRVACSFGASGLLFRVNGGNREINSALRQLHFIGLLQHYAFRCRQTVSSVFSTTDVSVDVTKLVS